MKIKRDQAGVSTGMRQNSADKKAPLLRLMYES
jgi:hypothetical protein